MTKRGDDEEEERQRQREERKKMRPVDIVYDELPTVTAAGDMHIHSLKRSGRKYPMIFRMTLSTRAVICEILKHHDVPSGPLLLELMVEAYLQKYRDPPITIPSEQELAERFAQQKDRPHGPKRGK